MEVEKEQREKEITRVEKIARLQLFIYEATVTFYSSDNEVKQLRSLTLLKS